MIKAEFCIATDREKLCCSFNNRITLQNSLPSAFFLCGLWNCFVFSTVLWWKLAGMQSLGEEVVPMPTIRLSRNTLDELLQHSVWLQQELLEKQDNATSEDDAVWLANRIYEIEKVKEQARLEALESA